MTEEKRYWIEYEMKQAIKSIYDAETDVALEDNLQAAIGSLLRAAQHLSLADKYVGADVDDDLGFSWESMINGIKSEIEKEDR